MLNTKINELGKKIYTTERKLSVVIEKKKRGRSRIDIVVQRAIDDLLDEGHQGAAAITRELDRNPKLAGLVPTSRTIQNYLKGRLLDPTGPWSMQNTEEDETDPSLVLPVLAAVLVRTEGRRSQLTNGEAKWVTRVRQVAPELPPWWAYRVARAFQARELQSEPTADLDLLMSFAPWRDPQYLSLFLVTIELAHPEWFPKGKPSNSEGVNLALWIHEDGLGVRRDEEWPLLDPVEAAILKQWFFELQHGGRVLSPEERAKIWHPEL